MSDVAHYWHLDYSLDALAIMYTNDDQFVPMNAISDAPTNFDLYHLIMVYSYLHVCCTYIVHMANINISLVQCRRLNRHSCLFEVGVDILSLNQQFETIFYTEHKHFE